VLKLLVFTVITKDTINIITLLINFPKQPGTYCFLNTVNNKIYVGSASCLYTRINNHFKNHSSNKHLQNAINRYGIEIFKITYVIAATHFEALTQEQIMLDYIFKNNVPKYNIANKVSGGCIGTKENHKNISLKGNNKERHKKASSKNNGFKAKVRYVLEIKTSDNIYIFESSHDAADFTNLSSRQISASCKTAKPFSSSTGRWLASDISETDLINKFKNLTLYEMKGQGQRPFILININNSLESQVFNKIQEPLLHGYKISVGNLSSCLNGKLKSVNGYRVSLCL
jgi:group I intron endonuclease